MKAEQCKSIDKYLKMGIHRKIEFNTLKLVNNSQSSEKNKLKTQIVYRMLMIIPE